MAQVGSVCLSVALLTYSVNPKCSCPGAMELKWVWPWVWIWPYCSAPGQILQQSPFTAIVVEADSFSEFLLQSLQNPVNLATQSAVAKTASDVPYLLTEWDLSQRVRLTWLTMQGQRKALYSWLVYEDAGFLPISNANCDLKLGQATVMLVFHCWLLHTGYQSYMMGKIY